MGTELSRRRLLTGLAAGVAVVGWNPLNRSWVTAAGARAPGTARVPTLDGTLETGPDTIAAFASDFGRLVSAPPTAVLRPGSVDDVVAMVGYARRHGLTVAMNGQAGTPEERESHSNYGQATAPGGIAIDAKGLSTIHRIGATSADVDAGVTWAELVGAAAAQGTTPPMLTDFLHLSIGGTLSVGGTGGTMQKVGTQADNVDELQVVTGRGELVTCSRSRNRALFDAVLAGAGQCGIIVRAKVRLVPAEARALVFNLFYDDLSTYLADHATVMDDGRFSYQEGQIVRTPDDSGWRYMMEVAAYFTPPDVPDQDALLAGLSDDRAAATVDEQSYLDWAFRLDPGIAGLKAAGFWDEPHPWLTVMVPASAAHDYLESVVAQLTPADLGAGFATVYPLDTTKVARPFFALPGERVAFQLNLLRFPFPGYPAVDALVAQNRTFFDEAVAVGGKRYVIGAIPDMTARDWRNHHGRMWGRFRSAKRRFDPHGVLTPGQGIFT